MHGPSTLVHVQSSLSTPCVEFGFAFGHCTLIVFFQVVMDTVLDTYPDDMLMLHL